MSKPVVLAATAAAMVLGISFAATSSADAGCRKHRHHGYSYGHGVVYAPDYGHRRYRSDYAYWYPYRPAYVYYPAPYPVRYAYGPVCARWGWTFNRYGEPRWRCISW